MIDVQRKVLKYRGKDYGLTPVGCVLNVVKNVEYLDDKWVELEYDKESNEYFINFKKTK